MDIKEPSILKKLPVGISREQRELFEALDIVCDMIDESIVDLEAILLPAIRQIAIDGSENIITNNRLRIFRHAWSIIDRIDLVRLILKGVDAKLVVSEIQISIFESACKMRNGMDHLGTWGNRKTRKKAEYPLFGYVIVNWYEPSEAILIEGKRTVFKKRATLVQGSAWHSHIKPFDIDLSDCNYNSNEIGNIRFLAFDEVISLTQAQKVVNDIRDDVNVKIRFLWDAALNSSSGSHLIHSDQPVINAGSFTVTETFPDHSGFVID